MSNGFSISPGNVPGNLTVGGTLIVNGGQMKVATDTTFMRFGKLDSGNTGLSWNKATEFGGQDDPAKAAFYQGFDTATGRCGGEILQPGSTDQQWHRAGALQTTVGRQTVTGTTETQLYSALLRKNIWGASRQARVQVVILGTVGTAAGSGLVVNASIAASTGNIIMAVPASHTSAAFRLELELLTDSFGSVFLYYGSATLGGSAPNGLVTSGGFSPFDFTIDNTLIITAKGGSASDTISTDLLQVFEYNTH